jgi:hypothetical protein
MENELALELEDLESTPQTHILAMNDSFVLVEKENQKRDEAQPTELSSNYQENQFKPPTSIAHNINQNHQTHKHHSNNLQIQMLLFGSKSLIIL